eukprot:m.6300 g.6300  ORF g.6300 m.6300 type:complete len:421 (+) comp15508_c0_seq1:84-1346(+)
MDFMNASVIDGAVSFEDSYALCNSSGRTTYMRLVPFQAIKISNIFETDGQVALWLLYSIIILIGNTTVLVWRFSRPRRERYSIAGIFTINLALSDFLLGIYMLLYLILIKWSCPRLADPKYTTLMVALCDLSGILEGMSVVYSGFFAATIAFHYSAKAFDSCRCWTPCFVCTKVKLLVVLVVQWVVAIAVGVGLTIPIRGGANFFVIKPQEVFAFDNENGELISQNRTISAIQGLACIPILSAVPYLTYYFGRLENAKQVMQVVYLRFCGVVFVVVAVLIGLSVVLYSGIFIKVSRLSRGNRKQLYTKVTALGLPLVAIAIITAICWIIFFFLIYERNIYVYQALIVLSTTAVVNPLVLTIFTKSFYKTIQKLRVKIRFHAGLPNPDAGLTTEDERTPLTTSLDKSKKDDMEDSMMQSDM